MDARWLKQPNDGARTSASQNPTHNFPTSCFYASYDDPEGRVRSWATIHPLRILMYRKPVVCSDCPISGTCPYIGGGRLAVNALAAATRRRHKLNRLYRCRYTACGINVSADFEALQYSCIHNDSAGLCLLNLKPRSSYGVISVLI